MYFVSLAVFIIGGCDDFCVVKITHVRNHLMLTHAFRYAQVRLSNQYFCMSVSVSSTFLLCDSKSSHAAVLHNEDTGFPWTFNLGSDNLLEEV